ncbi:hypothetical protein [Paenibacillus apii]|uniref:hypothetical protein n=1 Tax=Paenibacillus apii TaxID=1850370 RepID=UPI001439DE01|nr:hypothetical protein [Paenibacillus apii]NJJ37792.1 hypothetical protein [Paenibacillus apii]
MKFKKIYLSDIIFVIALVLWFWGSELVKKLSEDTWFDPVTKWMSNHLQFPVPFWAAIFVGVTVISIIIRIYNRIISNIKEQLEDEKRLLAILNEEQKPLQLRYLLSRAAQTFVETNPYAIAVQLFHYEIIIRRTETRIMVKNIGEHSREGENVNIFSQHYYFIPTKLYRMLLKAQNELKNGNILPTIQLANRLKNSLKSKPIDRYKETDAINFAFYRIALAMWGTHIGVEIELDLPDNKVQKLEALLRSGILIAILVNFTYYVFSNHGLDDKKDRVYYATDIETPRDKLLALIIFSPSLHDESNNEIDSTMNNADQVLRALLRKVYYNNRN